MRSVVIAIIVCPLLTLINQYEAMTTSATMNWVKVGLTFVVPFTVSIVSGLLAQQNTEKQPVILSPVDQRPAPAPLPTPRLPSINFDPAVDTISQIKANATNVNKTSIERVQFIGELVQRCEAINTDVTKLGAAAETTTEVIATVNKTTHGITYSVDHLRDDANEVIANVTAFIDITKDLKAHFDDVKAATEDLSSMSMKVRLLSLNASVEAARAGDAGKGFSVIAAEVRALAEKSSNDTKNIASVLAAMEAGMRRMTTMVGEVETRLSSTQDQTNACYDQAAKAEFEIADLSARLSQFSDDISKQLPAVVSLINDVGQIKNNTQAAVAGSAKNITLCDQAISFLKTVEQGAASPVSYERQRAS